MRGYTFDLHRFIADLGGTTAVHRRLVHLGYDVKVKTVKKWKERGDIALPYLVSLMADRAFEVGPLDFNMYIVATDDVRAPRRPPPGSASAPSTPRTSAVRG